MFGMLADIGIERGKPFALDASTAKILDRLLLKIRKACGIVGRGLGGRIVMQLMLTKPTRTN